MACPMKPRATSGMYKTGARRRLDFARAKSADCFLGRSSAYLTHGLQTRPALRAAV